jgi:hypothetical protein
MADKKISQLTTTTTIGDADLFTLVQSGVNKSITGEKLKDEVISEILGVEDNLTISSPGQTAFTLSGTPVSNASFALFLNGQLRVRGTDYTQTGTSVTWLDPGGLTLVTADTLIARYNVLNGGNGVKEVFLACTDYNANLGNYRTRSISATGGQRFAFPGIPEDFNSLVSIYLVGIVSSGADGSGKDIDIYTDYGGNNELYNIHTESDTTSTYDLTGQTNKRTNVIDLSTVLTNLGAGDSIGLFVDHKGIGGAINYIGIQLKYL